MQSEGSLDVITVTTLLCQKSIEPDFIGMFLFPVHNYAPQAIFGIKERSDHAESLCNFSPPTQSKYQCLAKILLLAAVTLVWMHNPPKSPTCCWTMSQIPKPRAAGELEVRVCVDMDFGVSIPQP